MDRNKIIEILLTYQRHTDEHSLGNGSTCPPEEYYADQILEMHENALNDFLKSYNEAVIPKEDTSDYWLDKIKKAGWRCIIILSRDVSEYEVYLGRTYHSCTIRPVADLGRNSRPEAARAAWEWIEKQEGK